jgi:glycine oxidase
MAFDVIVVGGGVIGCAIAHRVARRAGLRVLVVDRGSIGGEASTAAAGVLGAQAENDAAGPYLTLALRGRSDWIEYARELTADGGIDPQHWVCGLVRVGDPAELDRQLAWQREADLPVNRLSAAELRELEPNLAQEHQAGLLFPDDAQVDPRRVMSALGGALARAGVTLREGSPVALDRQGDRVVGVRVAGDRIAAGQVVLAAGAWSAQVAGSPLGPRHVAPVRGQMVELRPSAKLCSHILFSGQGYVVPRRDGRVVAGSTMESVGFERAVTPHGMMTILGMVTGLLPMAAHAALERSWSGFRPRSASGMPIIGPSPLEGLLVATGHFRNGILMAPTTAQLITDCLLGEKPSMDLSAFACPPMSVGTGDARAMKHDSEAHS